MTKSKVIWYFTIWKKIYLDEFKKVETRTKILNPATSIPPILFEIASLLLEAQKKMIKLIQFMRSKVDGVILKNVWQVICLDF